MGEPPPPPREPLLEEPLEPQAPVALDHDARFTGALLEAPALPGASARGVRIVRSRLQDADLSGSELDELELRDVVIAGGNLANLRAPRARWERVAVEGARLTGLALTEATLEHLRFSDCRVDLASFAGAQLRHVVFEDCVLARTDLLEAELGLVVFERCDLTALDVRGAKLSRCVLRDCRLDGIVGAERLRGAALPWDDVVGNAALWAGALGIEILDEPAG